MPFVRVSQIAVSTKLMLSRAAAKAKKATKRAAICAKESVALLKKRRELEPAVLPPRRGHALPRRQSAPGALDRPARVRVAPDMWTYKHHEPLLHRSQPVAPGP